MQSRANSLAAVPQVVLLGARFMTSEIPPTTLSALSLTGTSGGGLVKRLRGFRKDRHTLPDGVTPATEAFFARLCAEELAEEAEGWFQRARAAWTYKRADLRVELGSAQALLLARDFSLELVWALDPADTARYTTTRTLRDVRDLAFVTSAVCDSVFHAAFSSITFTLARGVSVEAVIDAVESLGDDAAMRVTYPSDCHECTVTVDGVEASVRCTGATLEMQFPRPGSPRELIEAFGAVRAAFRFTQNGALEALI